MLFPDFNELLSLGHKASRLQLVSGLQSTAASSGNYASPFRGQGLAFHEVREYRFGDDIRSIDWRVTARTNKPHLKVFTEERERTVILCVDANAAMRFGTRGTFKSVQAARAAALLGWHANGSNDRVGCVVFGDVPDGLQFFRPTRSRQALWKALKLLSEPAEGGHAAPVALEDTLKYLEPLAPRGALILVIGDFHSATETLERRLSDIRRACDIVLLAVNDPADREIPAMETVIFSDGAGRKLVLDTDNGAARDAYARQWRENRGRLEDIAARRGIGIIDLYTDKDVFQELLPGLRRLNLKKGTAMTAPSGDLLSQLDDIIGLGYISWWPLAPGWWALLALMLAASAIQYWRRRLYWRSWKGDARRALDALELQLPGGDVQQITAALSGLLRRIAIRCSSRAECAGLEGRAWLHWLSAKDPRKFDWAAKGDLLVEAPYAPPGHAYPPQNLKILIDAAKQWVR